LRRAALVLDPARGGGFSQVFGWLDVCVAARAVIAGVVDFTHEFNVGHGDVSVSAGVPRGETSWRMHVPDHRHAPKLIVREWPWRDLNRSPISLFGGLG
jgi:endo-beta-N-acetylglucosaminidase D